MKLGRPLYFCPVISIFFFFLSFYLFSSPNLSGRRLDVYHTSTQRCGLSANLECMSEMCCTWLADNTGRKNDAKNRHLDTIAQICRAISSQLMHSSTMEKHSLNSNVPSTYPHNMDMVNLGLL